MTSIYDIPKKEVDIFLEKNKKLIDQNDRDPYEILFEMIKTSNYLPNSVPIKIIDWIIAYNLKIKKKKNPQI
jgi:hypothetical protein